MERLPTSVDALLRQLDEEVRPPRPRPGMSWERVLYEAGQRDLVEGLLRLRDHPNED